MVKKRKNTKGSKDAAFHGSKSKNGDQKSTRRTSARIKGKNKSRKADTFVDDCKLRNMLEDGEWISFTRRTAESS